MGKAVPQREPLRRQPKDAHGMVQRKALLLLLRVLQPTTYQDGTTERAQGHRILFARRPLLPLRNPRMDTEYSTLTHPVAAS